MTFKYNIEGNLDYSNPFDYHYRSHTNSLRLQVLHYGDQNEKGDLNFFRDILHSCNIMRQQLHQIIFLYLSLPMFCSTHIFCYLPAMFFIQDLSAIFKNLGTSRPILLFSIALSKFVAFY